MGKVDDVGLDRGWVYVGSVDRCTLLVDDVELNVGGGTVDRWSLGVGADCFLFLFYYCIDMERYFQFHRPRSHGCWFSNKEPHKKCYKKTLRKHFEATVKRYFLKILKGKSYPPSTRTLIFSSLEMTCFADWKF